jgi:predicted TIM-barrel fold metal-dependent hydrolase
MQKTQHFLSSLGGQDQARDNREGTPSRRNFLAGFGALAAAACISNDDLRAQAPVPNTRRIDVHHHFATPKGLALAESFKPNGYQVWRGYSAEKALAALDSAGAATAILSGGIIDQAQSRDVLPANTIPKEIRELNDYGAKLVSEHKGRFGLWGVLPLPDVDASLREIEYVLDVLKADGVATRTSYGNKWLGDPAFQPVFDELNRRKAVVYTHPIDAPCCQTLIPGVPGTTIEYNTDTSRAIFSLINDAGAGSGKMSMATRYADVKFIWSHAGGSLLGLVGRFLGNAANGENIVKTAERNSKLYHLRRFYYDTAGSATPVEMQALKMLVGVSQILFGSDFPFGNPPVLGIAQGLQTCGFSEAELRGIARENALGLLPRFRT